MRKYTPLDTPNYLRSHGSRSRTNTGKATMKPMASQSTSNLRYFTCIYAPPFAFLVLPFLLTQSIS